MVSDGRRVGTRRRRAGRRRLYALAAVAIAVAIGAIAALPLFRRAIQELTLPLQYSSIIVAQAHAKHLDPALVAAVIYAETRFRPRTSDTGAEGLMQIEPATAKFLAHRSGATDFRVADLGHPAVNIAYGSYYLRILLNDYHGNKVLALAAYNGGETNVNNWIAEAHSDGHRFRISEIPIAQTRAYVAEVLGAQRNYRTKYASQLGYSSG
jgi:soluble lytic murein transglycosylase